MSAIGANRYVQANRFLAGWASLHCGQSMPPISWVSTARAAATSGDSWANSHSVRQREIDPRTASSVTAAAVRLPSVNLLTLELDPR